jgi:hypothetical protein
MKKIAIVLSLVAMVAAGEGSARGALIAYWNFNGLSIAAASTPGSGGVPTSIAADQGSGTLSLAGYGGTVDDFAGSTINAISPDLAEESLSPIAAGPAAGPFPGNGTYIDTTFSTLGFEDVVVTFATRGTATGFNSGLWSYSTDGTNFFPTGAPSTASVSTTFALATVNLSALSAIEGQSAVTLRYTLSGATSNSGNNRIDNLQVNGTPVPEPATAALVMGGMLGLMMVGRRNG